MYKGVDLAKKYGKNWIFRDLNFEIESGTITAITGKNGAGKSTLLQIIAGYLTPSRGEILFNDQPLEDQNIGIDFIGPYTEIIEEFTLREFLNFHRKFKAEVIPIEEMAEKASLPLDKQILEFSTGMKQRSKLLTAFYFQNDLIFMDEPTSNLDEEGFEWWGKTLDLMKESTVFIASNDKDEIEKCGNRLNL